MAEQKILPTTLVQGFLEAGKTTFLMECLRNDFFYKRGRTLLLSFEEGECEYDLDLLAEHRTDLALYDGKSDIRSFIEEQLAHYEPDRIYIEMNAMTDGLIHQLPQYLKVVFSVAIIDGSTLPLYLANLRQQLQNMIITSQEVIFNRCEKEALAPFGNIFRIMNNRSVYLWEGPTGYHEKAFGVMVPYDIDAHELILTDSDFTPFYLDGLTAPDRYTGKKITFLCRTAPDPDHPGCFKAGRQVMTCCLADVQFLGFPCRLPEGGTMDSDRWILLTATGSVEMDCYRQRYLCLKYESSVPAQPPKEVVLIP